MRNEVFCNLSNATKKCLMQLILNCIEHFLVVLDKLQQTQFFIVLKLLNFSKVQY
jgi:hypothetical protein